MEKYLLTLNKKLKERTDLNQGGMDRRCPGCHNRIHPQARLCPHCGQHLGNGKPVKGGDWQQKGFDHYQMGNYHEALRVFSIFIDLNPNADQAYYNRGVVYYRLNKHAEAMEDFKRAAQLGNTKAQNALQMLRNLDTQEMTPYSPPSA
jgi:tetratricopeptide (TPR) repeat protein